MANSNEKKRKRFLLIKSNIASPLSIYFWFVHRWCFHFIPWIRYCVPRQVNKEEKMTKKRNQWKIKYTIGLGPAWLFVTFEIKVAIKILAFSFRINVTVYKDRLGVSFPTEISCFSISIFFSFSFSNVPLYAINFHLGGNESEA